ncbi:PREDICTED: CRIB domain-containing protein RIC3-like isoform X1 [Lupinus angustifolius]|nr:PREDICTED: CRIB domain-containing protein RIC3-like isoform X1 [Lupinus angustifolius]
MTTSTTNVKGQVKSLLKGLRYISQRFDEHGGANDIQIGFPTDVKHLAHIGCDDSKAHKPSWMTEFKGPEEISSESAAGNSTKPLEDNKGNSGKVDGSRHHSRRSKHSSKENQSNSPSREQNQDGSVSKNSRRHHRSSDSSESSRRHSRHSNNNESGTEDEKPLTSTKHSHRRKSKTLEDKDGSVKRSSRTSRRGSKESSLTDSEVS